MSWNEFTKKLSLWAPAVTMENIISHQTRKIIKTVLLFLTITGFVLASQILFVGSQRLTGLFFIVLFFYLLFLFSEAFFYSVFFRKEDSYSRFGYFLTLIIFQTRRTDLTKGFLKSGIGQTVMDRLGIDEESVQDFLKRRKFFLSAQSLKIEESESLWRSYLSAIFTYDKEFQSFLLLHEVTKEILLQSSDWVLSLIYRSIDSERWWSKKKLQSIGGIGRAWSYGNAYVLEQFSSPLSVTSDRETGLHETEAISLEVILSKSVEANALIIGDDGVGKIEVVETLFKKINSGESSPELRDKKFLVFDSGGFISQITDKEQFESILAKIFFQTAEAGNIVLVIPDFDGLVNSANLIGTNLSDIIDSYLSSSAIHIVAISNTRSFHTMLEPNQSLMQRFDKLMIKGGTAKDITAVLENSVMHIEHSEGVFFTYQAITETVKAAERYFIDRPLYDAATDLLIQAVSKARSQDRALILKEDVLSLIKSQTGIATGAISIEEKNKLENLEEHLHMRIVGQDEAVSGISNALRRARAGISNPNRPIGSFLFIGPTGVGKTETTKALGEIFFGAENKILRLDMSEYNSSDALNRLIGSISNPDGGVLGSMLRENPYGVLLLDEFEKTENRVLDLFLQILDEGIFSDSLGRKVSARNLIIIATSNAGSDIIFDIISRRENLSDKKDFIVDEIIRRGIYKPELINRFDGVILFHPLEEEHLKKIARLQLEGLAWRLKDKGIMFQISEPIINFLVEKGTDPKFGARALKRALQDSVEKAVAEKIIDGNIRPGSELSLTTEDLK
ncbi:MAG: hypothetical protein CO184_00095 [Candidatus Zambryskibacteria bacterium CG_4_9_14_3_um_filter_40_16]|uniref:Clp R domain-containing protein n=2 Tax=Candidatus Zambryskiibacteriota TaxID=1817925 RepID=A0A2H0K890_9BACT|nr:MAG: hypothetical protein COV95_02215 [Candidatus Zambryskibacteria bacterium CG11_big_fil_rev_8_21_14_0_20_40_24]PJA34480.1 MAG: hypothetical protein CO184_00095 [Candidatus Zambryskibacteria bacterium CG_4_9_14_3_um_filter_40_16]